MSAVRKPDLTRRLAPADHVREGLAAASADLPGKEAAPIIEAAFHKGLANPRNLPTEEAGS